MRQYKDIIHGALFHKRRKPRAFDDKSLKLQALHYPIAMSFIQMMIMMMMTLCSGNLTEDRQFSQGSYQFDI